MLKVDIDPELLQKVINEAVDKAIERHALKDSLPPLLTRNQLMDLLGIKSTKIAELFNRPDFPVIREFGHPRVPTKQLFEWIEHNTQWVNNHSKNPLLKKAI